MQVSALPTLGVLNSDVYVIEFVIIRNSDSPPNRRIGLDTGDLKLEDAAIGPSSGHRDGDCFLHAHPPEPILAKPR